MSIFKKQKTRILQQDQKIEIIYHTTKVVEVNKKERKIKLNSDGWRTVTTKRRMNQAGNLFNLGFSVYQKNYEWFVVTVNDLGKTTTLKYFDGIEIDY